MAEYNANKRTKAKAVSQRKSPKLSLSALYVYQLGEAEVGQLIDVHV